MNIKKIYDTHNYKLSFIGNLFTAKDIIGSLINFLRNQTQNENVYTMNWFIDAIIIFTLTYIIFVLLKERNKKAIFYEAKFIKIDNYFEQLRQVEIEGKKTLQQDAKIWQDAVKDKINAKYDFRPSEMNKLLEEINK